MTDERDYQPEPDEQIEDLDVRSEAADIRGGAKAQGGSKPPPPPPSGDKALWNWRKM